MDHAYRSLNNVLATAWAAIAPGVPIEIDSPDDATAIPPECLRVYWGGYGTPERQANLFEAVVDVAVRVPPMGNAPNTLLMTQRCKAIYQALGIVYAEDGQPMGGGYGRLGRFDWTVTPLRYLSAMEIFPTGGGWTPIPTKSPGELHTACTFLLNFRT